MIARTQAFLIRGASAPLAALVIVSCTADAPETSRSDHYADTGGSGFCRTTTCLLPDDLVDSYPTDEGQCLPVDWSHSRTCVQEQHASNAPLWWHSACVGYDLNERASKRVSYEVFAAAVRGAFSAWVTATCPSRSSASRTSIDVRDLGSVSCNAAEYNKDGPNQNVITFHDDAWPYEQLDRAKSGDAKSRAIAQTVVTYDPLTGELLDADIELNSADYTIVPLDGPADRPDTYDLQSVLTHEIGHFLGLAHSPNKDAVMYKAGDSTGGGRKRELRLEDVRGICAIYPPDGSRSVSTLVNPSGAIAAGACDPTPRRGLGHTCRSTSTQN